MQTININELDIGKIIGCGNWSSVNECDLGTDKKCVKFFRNFYPLEIKNNIINLTDIDFSKEYFTPLYVVENNSGRIIGYVMNYNSELEELKYDKYSDSLKMLKNAKNLLNVFHNEYKRFHGDISLDNMLFNKKDKSAYLIDFDISLKEDEELKSLNFFRLFIKDYLKYYKQDRYMDIYSFNLLTLKYLYNYTNYVELLDDIYEGKIYYENKDIKKLSKELLLMDVKKKYSGEYIVDYM